MPASSTHGLTPPIQVYKVVLQDNGAPQKGKTYLRLPPPVNPFFLRISIEAGATASRDGILFTNFPLDGSPFDRAAFHQVVYVMALSISILGLRRSQADPPSFSSSSLPQDFSKPFDIDLRITKAGAFEYYMEHSDGSEAAPTRVRCSTGYFSVEPILSVPSRSPILSADHVVLPVGKGGVVNSSGEEVNLALDALVIQSVIAKWMGTFEEWGPHLDLMRDRGYNMIHFTPLQERGESGSPYSIFDQLAFANDLFGEGNKLSNEEKSEKMKVWLARIKKEWGMLGMIDVVLNHTANNSLWLQEHPESGYNVVNSPHLESALELDNALLEFSSSLEKHGLPSTLTSATDLDSIMNGISQTLLPSLKLYEYYTIDVATELEKFTSTWTASESSKDQTKGNSIDSGSDKALATAFAKACLPENWTDLGSRFGVKVDQKQAVRFVAKLLKREISEQSKDDAVKTFKRILDIVNLPRYQLYDDDIKAILENTRSRIRYTRLDDDGPKLGPVTPKSPLVETLFTKLPQNARTKPHDPKSLSLANNGWIWDADPLQDFASASSRTYLRRELIVWGDCVKLRYGAKPADSPWLWEHMIAYVKQLAGLFHGFRLDNSHSTPIHVGEILLDEARRVNPNLYVCAELFTGREELDLLFVCRLGLNSLIREAMNAGDPKDQSRLLYQYGLGKPIGSMDTDCLSEESTITLDGQPKACLVIPHAGSSPHAFFMDCTHDNESPQSKRTAEDALSTGSLVTFSRSAIGSNRGFDDLYPKLLDVVTEERHYEVYKDSTENGIGGMKRLLNHIHTELVLEGAVEGHFSQEGEYITSHRVNPVTHKGYLLVTRTAFSLGSSPTSPVAPIRLDGTRVKFVAGASIKINSREPRDTKETLRGLDATILPISLESPGSQADDKGQYSEIIIPKLFPAGSVLVFATWMDQLPADLDELCSKDADKAFSELDMVDLNVLLYRADGEERDAVDGDGVYTVPGLDPLVYCGLQGWMAHLKPVIASNDLGHPLCAHLRNGHWALDYVHARLEKQVKQLPHLRPAADWFKARFDILKKTVPAFLLPKYFSLVINVAFKAACDRAIKLCTPFVRDGPSFTRVLALTSVQMYGQVRSASLDPTKSTPSLAAGLPHFTTGWARTWGRDVFISLRGLLLVTGQFDAARDHILAFCSVLKHGLIPNLLDSGKTPRYNSRDSPWFMLQAIQDYVTMAPNGIDLLKATVLRRFPLSDEWIPYDDPKAYATTSTVADIVQEILQRHATGIKFREYNAGPNLDMQMTDKGFNIDISVDWETGVIHGGNEFNCGTWQDKMGESEKAGNKGLPGSPRDGAPVEIIGLLKSTLRWVAELSAEGLFPHKGVDAIVEGKKKVVSWKEWDQLLLANFERLYYVPSGPKEDKKHIIDHSFVARRGIYKDVFGSGSNHARADYQLRSNFAIAMAVAPELFDPAHALEALKIYQKFLVGPLGVKTLDPADPDYRGNYDNSNDSSDRSVAKGWNYHQGPEWVWPIGYFLRAYLIFDKKAGPGKKNQQVTFHHIYKTLAQHRAHLRQDAWAGLPELTNENGDYCSDSCRTQAWSSSTILDVLQQIADLK